jgi:hypothetical protein
MEKLIQKFKEHVVEASANPSFLHHDWFVEYHLNFVEKISLELCEKYPEADKNIVLVLVWIHDYAKILDKEKEHEESMFEKGRGKLIEIGFDSVFVDKVISNLAIFEKKMEIDLNNAPIEVKIVSSADGASHLVGPFFAIYFKEFSNKTIQELVESGKNKLKKDWERKIVLPEVKEAFLQRNKFFNEQFGNLPEKYLE